MKVPALLVTAGDVTPERELPMPHHSIPKTIEPAIIDGETARIPLRSGKYPGLFALVDTEDVERIQSFKWSPRVIKRRIYARRYWREGPKVISLELHTEIMGTPPPGFVIDHINGDGLDNRKSNLRFATHQQNHWNKNMKRGKYKGVSYVKEIGLWQARIRFNGVDVHLGYHTSDLDAARAHDFAASRLHGEFAYLNFPEEGGDA